MIDPTTMDIVKLASDLGSTAIVGFLALWLIMKGIPAINKAFTTALGDQRKDFREEMGSEREHNKEIVTLIANNQKEGDGK